MQPCNLSSCFSGLSLVVIKVSRDGDDSAVHVAAQVVRGHFPKPRQDEGGDLLRGVLLSLIVRHPGVPVRAGDNAEGHLLGQGLHLRVGVAPPDEALRGEEGVPGVDDHLPLRGEPDEPVAGLVDGEDGGGGPLAVVFDDHRGAVGGDHRDAGVGRPEIYADDGPAGAARVRASGDGREVAEGRGAEGLK